MALIAARGDDMWGANEFTQSILRWKRGTSVTVEELKLPVVLHRTGRRQGQNKHALTFRFPSPQMRSPK